MAAAVPFLPREQLRRLAAEFLSKYHPTLDPPVPIDEIVEFDLGIHVVPVDGLDSGRGINGFISADLSTIFVERHFFENVPNRHRFTLAHEVGHLVLHGDQYGHVCTKEDWLRGRRALTEQDIDFAEWQADEFAGLLLVPPERLEGVAIANYRAVVRAIRERAPEIDTASDMVWSIVAKKVGAVFQVSETTARIRLERDEIWRCEPD